MGAATQHFLTIEEYLRTIYRPDCDYVDGHLEERTRGEREHSILQAALCGWFFTHRSEWEIVVMSEQRTRASDTRVRLPDLCLISAEAPRERVTLTPPLLAVKILSREDRVNRVVLRLDDFLAMGVANLWLLDPLERVAYTYSGSGLKLMQTPRMTIPNSPLYLDLPELFSVLD